MISKDDNSMEGKNHISLKKFCRLISNIAFNDDASFGVDFDNSTRDKRIQSMRALMRTECTYLQRIKVILKDIVCNNKKILKSILRPTHIPKLLGLLECFPKIYELHVTLNNKMKEQLKESAGIGYILFEFLSQTTLLDIYTNYMSKYSESLEICKYIKDKQYNVKYPMLSQLEAIMMSPIQRFPQLSMAIYDLFKYTPDNHRDKIDLYKAISISKAITSRLDLQRREFEYTDIEKIKVRLAKLKLPFQSQHVLANNSAFKILTDFHIPRRVDKIQYCLILCDRNVIMLPRDVPAADFTDKNVFSYSLEEVFFQNHVTSSFSDQMNYYTDYEEAKDLYRLIDDSSTNDVTLNEYDDLLHDYKALLKIADSTRLLKFRYKGIDTAKVSKSIVYLEEKLQSKEMELNLQLGSILSLTVKTCNCLEDKHIFLFDSLRQSNEWKMKFHRATLLVNIGMNNVWKHYSFSKRSNPIKPTDLPLLFSPFLLKDNGIMDVPPGIIVTKAVALIVGLKLFRCLWVCLTNGWVLVLHFDHKRWRVLETFRMDIQEPVRVLCISRSSNTGSHEYTYDSEIWMSSGESVWIHSLLDNQRSSTKHVINFPSEIKAMCNVGGDILVTMKSKKIFVYSKSKSPCWVKKTEILFKRLITTYAEELMGIHHGHGMIYVSFKSKIIVYKREENEFSFLKVFESPKEITTLSVTLDGVWVTENNPIQLLMYDKMLESTLQRISLPLLIHKTHPVGTITSILIDDRNIWLGTENGLIICISKIDSLYCTDEKIPMYFSSNSSVGPITQLMPFQNMYGVNIQHSEENCPFQRNEFDERVSEMRRSISQPSLTADRTALSDDNGEFMSIPSADESQSSLSPLMVCALDNLKSTTPILILAIGVGIAKYVDYTDGDQDITNVEVEHKDQSTLFTFLE